MSLLTRISILFCLLVSPMVWADTLVVAVASNFHPAARELAATWSADTGHEVRLVAGATGTHHAQIRQGAPFDAWLAADRQRPQQLLDAGEGLADSLFIYARGRLALWSPEPGRLEDGAGWILANPGARLAVANPRLAPYGVAALETLSSLGVAPESMKLVQGQNVAQAFQFVASGNAPAGLVAWSLVLMADEGSHWLVPAGQHAPIEQAAVALVDRPAVHEFLAYLRSPAAHDVIRRYGYDVADGP